MIHLHSHGYTVQDGHPAPQRCCHRDLLGGISPPPAAAAQTPYADTAPGTEAFQSDPEL